MSTLRGALAVVCTLLLTNDARAQLGGEACKSGESHVCVGRNLFRECLPDVTGRLVPADAVLSCQVFSTSEQLVCYGGAEEICGSPPPPCIEPGSFPVAGRCSSFYSCLAVGDQLIQVLAQCEEGFEFSSVARRCISTTTANCSVPSATASPGGSSSAPETSQTPGLTSVIPQVSAMQTTGPTLGDPEVATSTEISLPAATSIPSVSVINSPVTSETIPSDNIETSSPANLISSATLELNSPDNSVTSQPANRITNAAPSTATTVAPITNSPAASVTNSPVGVSSTSADKNPDTPVTNPPYDSTILPDQTIQPFPSPNPSSPSVTSTPNTPVTNLPASSSSNIPLDQTIQATPSPITGKPNNPATLLPATSASSILPDQTIPPSPSPPPSLSLTPSPSPVTGTPSISSDQTIQPSHSPSPVTVTHRPPSSGSNTPDKTTHPSPSPVTSNPTAPAGTTTETPGNPTTETTPTSTLQTTTSTTLAPCTPFRKQADPNSCKHFYWCLFGRRIRARCPFKWRFDEESKRCKRKAKCGSRQKN